MKRSGAPDFVRDGITWQCWVDGEGSYVWKTTDGSLSVGRVGKEFWAKIGERKSRFQYARLLDAMIAAMAEKRRKAA